jgi:hypothetical protein
MKKIWVILLLGAFIRIPLAATYHVGHDEGHFLYDSWLITLGLTPFKDYTSRSLPLLLALLPTVQYHSLILSRMVTVACTVVSAYFIYLLARKINEDTALLASGIFLFSPLVVFNTAQVMNTPIQTMFVVLAMYFLTTNKPLLSGFSAGVGFLSTEFSIYPLTSGASVDFSSAFQQQWSSQYWRSHPPYSIVQAGCSRGCTPTLSSAY